MKTHRKGINMHRLKQLVQKDNIFRFLLMNFGLIIVAASTFFFKNPNKIAAGGVNGVAIIIKSFLPDIPIGFTMLIMNILFLILAFFLVSKQFALKSVYGSIMLSVYILLFEEFTTVSLPLTNQVFMELIYATIFSGIGITVVFYTGGSSGGTDIVAKILSKYFGIKISLSTFISDVLIALFAGFVYGVEVCLLSLMGVILKSFVIDFFLESLQSYKVFTIISDKPEEIKEYIVINLHRGATIHKAEGAFTDIKKEVITTVISKTQAIKLQDFIQKTDPKAFVIITNSSSIVGRGFVSSI